jgi:hypothetical protein
MSKIWFCRNCGYEVGGRGRCHACKARLSTSPLPELPVGDEDDEVGYRLEDWSPRSRGRLIVRLIEANVLHRFEEDELVVSADDETRTDDLVEEVASVAEVEPDVDVDGPDVDALVADATPIADGADDGVLRAEVGSLFAAAGRLRKDPTDMQADSDLAHASATVFIADGFAGADAATWAAVGRVTRRLLAALGAEEALEEEITLQAGILVKLLDPLMAADPVVAANGAPAGGGTAGADAGHAHEEAVEDNAVDDDTIDDDTVDEEVDGVDAVGEDGVGEDGVGEDGDEEVESGTTRGQSVYELPEWLPEQRAQLSLHLDEAGIHHEWEGGDLVVAVEAEPRVEELFDRIEGVDDGDDDGARYRALEALFAAADRFVNDPDSRTKRNAVVQAVADADGPTPLGLDDAQWWSIRSRARILADSIEHDANLEVIFGEATTLRDLLRVLV